MTAPPRTPARVLITGHGGFVGSAVCRQLLARGDRVVGVARGDYPAMVDAGVEQRRGDLTDLNFARDAIRDVDAVVHTAAIAGVSADEVRYQRINVDATENVIDACRAAPVRSLVFTSSPSVTFDGTDQRGVDESVGYSANHLCAYSRTKAEAEALVLAADDPGDLRTVALRPHLIWGPGDPHLEPRVVAKAKAGRLRIVGDGDNRIDVTHVDNAAAAHLNALDVLASDPDRVGGRAFFLSDGEPVRAWDWIRDVCRRHGVEPPRKRVSLATAYRIGAVLETVYRIVRPSAEPPMTRFVAAQLGRDHYFDITAARERLGYRPETHIGA